MGNSPCAPCPTAATGSVINLSDGLVLKLSGDRSEGEVLLPHDYDLFEKLKCIDDSHSQAYGLTADTFDMLIKKLEMRLKEIKISDHCPKDHVIKCLKTHPECTITCAKEVEEFIDCVDTKRLSIIRKKYFDTQSK